MKHKIGFIGLGLIGGSIAKAIRQYRYEQYEENRGKKEELEEEINELNQRIEDLDKKIGEIYTEYYLNEE